jgi:uncharacterized protein YdhG (YjbR/CyaY superfamily)
MPSMKTMSSTVDEYLAAVPDSQRHALEALRKTIKGAAPGAVEVISYGIAMLKLDGKGLVAFGAAKGYSSFYVMSPAVMKAHRQELKEYDTTKGTIHFMPNKPLPSALVKKLVKARIAENKARKAR